MCHVRAVKDYFALKKLRTHLKKLRTHLKYKIIRNQTFSGVHEAQQRLKLKECHFCQQQKKRTLEGWHNYELYKYIL